MAKQKQSQSAKQTATQKQSVKVIVNNILDTVKIKSRKGKRYLVVGKRRRQLKTKKKNEEIKALVRKFVNRYVKAAEKKGAAASSANLLPLFASSQNAQGLFTSELEKFKAQTGFREPNVAAVDAAKERLRVKTEIRDLEEFDKKRNVAEEVQRLIYLFTGDQIHINDGEINNFTLSRLEEILQKLRKVNLAKLEMPMKVSDFLTKAELDAIGFVGQMELVGDVSPSPKVRPRPPPLVIPPGSEAPLTPGVGEEPLSPGAGIPPASEAPLTPPPRQLSEPSAEFLAEMSQQGMGDVPQSRKAEVEEYIALLNQHRQNLPTRTVQMLSRLLTTALEITQTGQDPTDQLDSILDIVQTGLERATQEGDQEGSGPGEALSNHEIQDLMDECDDFMGVFAVDTLPKFGPFNRNKKEIPKSISLIVNTEPIRVAKGHWVALRMSRGLVEYFDPLGRSPGTDMMKQIRRLVKGMKNVVGPGGYQFKVNSVRLQGDSDNCGWFAMKFLKDRTRGKTWKEATMYREIEDAVQQLGEGAVAEFKKVVGDFKEI